MVECRKYSDFASLKNCADLIYKECAEKGLSEGWSGTQEDFDVVERLCEKLGIEYVDDFNGTWRPKKKQTKKEAEESDQEKYLEELRERLRAGELESKAAMYAEKIGVYEYKVNGSLMEYWSFYGPEGWYFVRYDLENEKEVFRGANIPWDDSLNERIPAFLRTKDGFTMYNYMQG